MKTKGIGLTLVATLIFTLSWAAPHAFATNKKAKAITDGGDFAAPVIDNRTNASASTSQGAIIFDSSNNTFYGNTVVPAGSGPTWISLGGPATLNYWSGYQINGNEWGITGTSYGALTHLAGTVTLTQRYGSGISVSTAASGAGITWMPASTSSVYYICAAFAATQSVSWGSFELTDTVNTPIAQRDYEISGTSSTTVNLCGMYAPNSSSSVTVQIYGLSVSSGESFIGNLSGAAASIDWSLVQVQ